jgi:hypothetical protein
MRNRVLILDTSVLCCWIKVPGKQTAGPSNNRWDHDRINDLLTAERKLNTIFVLPLATLIETGNHIAQASGERYELASNLAACLRQAADECSPWAAFTAQSELWSVENLRVLADSWPKLAASGITLGDATIKDVADYYAKAGYDVEIVTGDQALKAHEPTKPVAIPRRRK